VVRPANVVVVLYYSSLRTLKKAASVYQVFTVYNSKQIESKSQKHFSNMIVYKIS